MAEQARGCLYDGTADVKTFSEGELRQVKSALPPQTKDTKGAGFRS